MNGKGGWTTRLAGACCLWAAAHATPVGVSLHDGSEFTGELTGVRPERLELDSYWAERPHGLPFETVKELRLSDASRIRPRGLQVDLTGGTRLWLQDVNVSDRGISGRSHRGGLLDLSFADVEQILFTTANQARLRKDPGGPQVDDLQWAGQRRDVPLEIYRVVHEVAEWPEQFYLDVRLEDPGAEPRFQLMCTGPNPGSDSHFLVRVNPNVVTVVVTDPTEKNLIRPSYIHYPLSAGQSVSRVRITGDLSTGRLQLQVGEGEVLEWTMGVRNLFQSTLDQPCLIALQEFRASLTAESFQVKLFPWQGDGPPPLPLTEPGVLLTSGEHLKGSLRSLSDTRVQVTPPEGGLPRSLTYGELLAWRPDVPRPSELPDPAAVAESRRAGEYFIFQDLRPKMEPRTGELQFTGKLPGGTWLTLPSGHLQSVRFLSPPGILHRQTPEPPLRRVFVELLNGDTLYGSFLGIRDSMVMILPEWEGAEPVRLIGAAVESLRFRPDGTTPDRPFQIGLRSGGRLLGDVLSLSERQLVIQTAWADRLSLPRGSIHRLKRRPAGTQTVSLLNQDLEGWTYYEDTYQPLAERPDVIRQTPAGWKMQEGEYYCQTPPYPADRVSVDLLLRSDHWLQPGIIAFEFAGFSSPEGEERRVRVRIHSRELFAEVFEGSRLVQRWSGYLADDTPRSLPFRLRVNGRSGLLRLQVGDQFNWEMPLPDWEFSQEPTPYRYWISIFGERREVSLQRLQFVREPEDGVPDIQLDDLEPGQLLFRNGDRMQADLVQIREGEATLELENGIRIPMPLARMYHVAMPQTEPAPLRRKASHARFELYGGEEVLLAEVMEATPEEIVVRREGVPGFLRLPVENLSAIQLNPYFQR